MNCSTEIGHESCGLSFVTTEHEGHKAAPNAWERSKNKVYFRKMKRQHGQDSGGPTFTFKKGKR